MFYLLTRSEDGKLNNIEVQVTAEFKEVINNIVHELV